MIFSYQKIFFCIILLFCNLTCAKYADAAPSIPEDGSAASPGISWYRNEFVDIKESRDKGVSVSVGVSSLNVDATVDELFNLYEQSNFDAALDKINELKSPLRHSTVPLDNSQKNNFAILLDFTGVILQRKGEFSSAINAHNEALILLKELGWESKAKGLAVRNNLAAAQYLMGNYEASERLLTDILNNSDIESITRARARNNRGLIYTEIGLSDKAIVDFSYAEKEARGVNSRQLLAEVLNNKARGLAKQKNRPEAERTFSEALEHAVKAKDIALKANILDSWAEMLVDEGDFQAALDKLIVATDAEVKVNAPLIRCTILKNRGRALAGLGKSEDALKAFSDAFDLADDGTMNLSSQKRDILAYRGNLQAKLNNLDQAIEDYGSAIALAENTREHLGSESEAGFIQATERLYREMIVVLLKRKGDGDAETAYSMLERSRSAMLQEQMATETPELRDKQAMRDISGARGALRQEAALARNLQIALSASNPDLKNIAALRQHLAKAREKAIQALGELSDKYKGRYDHFVPAAVDPKYLRDVAGLLPSRSLLVTYSFGDDGLYIFLASSDGKIEFRQTKVTKAELERKIEEYRSLVINPPYKSNPPGKSREDWRIDSWSESKWMPLRDATVWLYQQLLEPIADRIRTVDQVIFAPTGKMYYLPFHALGLVDATGRQMQYLALSKKVSYVAPGSLLKAFDAGRGIKPGMKSRILAFGDVQFGSSSNLQQLPSSKDELKAVKDIFGPGAVVLAGQNATKQGLLDTLNTGNSVKRHAPSRALARRGAANSFNFMLLSTHGILKEHDPRTSYLAMEDNNKLTAQEIGGLDLRGVSVVALSACETFLAGQNPGNDLMSLGEYVSLAGASSVLATLWQVDDLQTANLMKQFFTHLKQDANNKSAALQYAQVAMASRPESTNPFFWSPFVLYGRGW